jgi:hypothetical protein
MGDTINKLLRKGALKLPFADPVRRVALARRIRGKMELAKLSSADVVFLSYGKSGRTWVRVMLSRAYQLRYGLPQDCLLDFDNMKLRDPAIPAIFFTHGHYIEDYTGDRLWKDALSAKKVAWLVRDPRDVAVSLYFQWKHRMTDEKIAITRYPPADPTLSLYDFVMGPDTGFLARILDHMAEWERDLPDTTDLLLLRYEDFRARPAETLNRLLAFMGTPMSDEEVQGAVDFAAFENMKKMEAKKVFRLSGGRVTTRDPANPDAYKARRAKVGGWRDYFSDPEVAAIETLTANRLSASFGYSHGDQVANVPVTAKS